MPLRSPDSSAEPITVILAALVRVRTRWIVVSLLRGVLWSAVAAGATYAIVDVTSLLFGRSPRADLVSVAAFAAGVVVTIVVVAMRAPRLHRLAQVADRRFGLLERISAAYEVPRNAESSRVERALLRDAANHVAAIDARTLVPVPVRQTVVLALAPGLLVLAVSWLPVAAPVPPGPERNGSPAPWAYSEEELVEVRATVRRIALLLNQEAQRQDDPDLLDLAREFEDVSERLALGTATVGDLSTDIDRVLMHAAQAFGLAEATGVRAGDGLGPEPANGDRPASTARPATSRPGETAPTDDGRGVDPLDRTTGPKPGEMTLDSLLERLEMDALAQAAPQEGANLDDVRFRQGQGDLDDGTYFDSPELQAATERILDNIRRQRDAQAFDGGEAFDGTGRRGADAGGATAPIDQGARGDALNDEFDAQEQLLLPATGRATGRRIELQPPSRVAARSRGSVSPVDAGRWSQAPEEPREAERLSYEHREIVAAYFAPDQIETRGPSAAP